MTTTNHRHSRRVRVYRRQARAPFGTGMRSYWAIWCPHCGEVDADFRWAVAVKVAGVHALSCPAVDYEEDLHA